MVEEGSRHEQALDSRSCRSPFWLSLQFTAAKVGIAVAVAEGAVKVAQKERALSRRPGVWVARRALRQLSAPQSAETSSPAPARRAAVVRKFVRIFLLGLRRAGRGNGPGDSAMVHLHGVSHSCRRGQGAADKNISGERLREIIYDLRMLWTWTWFELL